MHKIKVLLKFSFFLITILFFLSLFASNEKQLGCGYWYDIENKCIFGPSIDIPPSIEKFEYNNDYIIVEQKPQEKEDIIYERIYNYPLGRDTTYYWIIFKKRNTYYGPIIYDDMQEILKNERINITIK